MIVRHTDLPAHITAFARHLRQRGFPLTPTDEVDALRGLVRMGMSEPVQPAVRGNEVNREWLLRA